MTTFMYGMVVVSSADMPEDVRLVRSSAAMNFSASVLMPRSNDLEAGALEHHPDEVLADVVDVALDGADDDLADRLRAGLGEQRAEDRHAGLHRVRGEQDLGHEQDAVAEVDADDLHARRQARRRGPWWPRQPRPSRMLVPSTISSRHAVVEVVVHLLGELVVGERREIDLLRSRRSSGRSGRSVWSGSGGAVTLWVPHRGTVPYDGTPREANLADEGSLMSRVQSIERAFAVLGALADGPIGVTEVAERVGLPKSTAARLLPRCAARAPWSRSRATRATGSGRGS